jgi:hypothetical protein
VKSPERAADEAVLINVNIKKKIQKILLLNVTQKQMHPMKAWVNLTYSLMLCLYYYSLELHNRAQQRNIYTGYSQKI